MNIIRPYGYQISSILKYMSRYTFCTSIHEIPEKNHKKHSVNSTDVRKKLQDGPSLEYFLANSNTDNTFENSKKFVDQTSVPYLNKSSYAGHGRKVYFETYGCQMNVNDTEIAWAILQTNGFHKTEDIKKSDVVLVMTCAIREGAEQKIWQRLKYLKQIKHYLQRSKKKNLKIGILGCMAERLKNKILEKEKMVDLVCGPDAYRDLPHMLAVTDSGQTAVNVILSLDETYADVVPVRLNDNSTSAFVSIMRGCDNMCSYCIVPFTRGRERSRPVDSILEEVHTLSQMGIKEITLLGQNVNSYRDTSEVSSYHIASSQPTNLAKGFKTVYKSKLGGQRFSHLLEKVSEVDPEMRIRFTSPHPKDFPDEVLYLIKDRLNICNNIHLPAQSGSTRILEAMRRGYSREAYIDLINHVQNILPDVSFSSDFISGFCGETELDHKETISLLRLLKYSFAFCFPYSMRQKTHAYHKLEDNVPEDIKSRRHLELISVFREEALKLHQAQHGQTQLVLVEGESKRSSQQLSGRNESNTKVIFERCDLPICHGADLQKSVQTGDYVAVKVNGSSSQVLKGEGLYLTNINDFYSQTESKMSSSIT